MSDLHDLSAKLFQLAPWNRVDERQLIAMDDPATGRRDHISLMGMAGNHHALALYSGSEGRRRFNLLQAQAGDLSGGDMTELILTTPQLQCAFSTRAELYPRELAAIKQAGRKYRGDNWPSFRVFHPGHCPRPANEAESVLLATAIQQVLDLAPVLQSGKPTIRPVKGTGDGFEILTRQYRDGAWQSVWTPDDDSLYTFPHPQPDPGLVKKVRGHAQAIPLNVLCQLLPTPVGKSQETSVYPTMLLLIEPGHGSILGAELLSTEQQTYQELLADIPGIFLNLCDRHNLRPSAIAVTSPLTQALLTPTAKALGIPCVKQRQLPALDAAVNSMMEFLGGRGL